MYKRQVVYVSVLLEFFEYAIDPAMLDHWGGILTDIHGRIKMCIRDRATALHYYSTVVIPKCFRTSSSQKQRE